MFAPRTQPCPTPAPRARRGSKRNVRSQPHILRLTCRQSPIVDKTNWRVNPNQLMKTNTLIVELPLTEFLFPDTDSVKESIPRKSGAAWYENAVPLRVT
jgi:hypothetical protein